MIKIYRLLVTAVLLLSLSNCSSGDDGGSNNNNNNNNNNIYPTNLNVTIEIEGQDGDNPNGDGSGVFRCIATATNAVNYGFVVNNGSEVQSPSGSYTHTLYAAGDNQVSVIVKAYSSTNNFTESVRNFTVFVDDSGNTNGCPDLAGIVWCDEFNGSGGIDEDKWSYQTGGGGWGNQEAQIYSNNTNYVKQEGGFLKIQARKVGSSYYSGRIQTKGKYEFQYGRVDIRAKLPTAQGTWPALWMLGANYDSVGWPECGEIDIMEQFENKNSVTSTLHWKKQDGTRGDYGQDVTNSTFDQFHIYSMEWDSQQVRTYLDGQQFYAIDIADIGPYYPFNKPFFFIFNLAMGGTNGGTIDPNFTADSMEVDYIRVFE